jgi:hypothetical protein
MGHVPKYVLSASASPDGWPEKARHIGGQKAECLLCLYTVVYRYHHHNRLLRGISCGRGGEHFIDP